MPTISKENFVLLFTTSTDTCKKSSAIENFVPTIYVTVKVAARLLLFFLGFCGVRNCSQKTVELKYLPFSFLKIYGTFGVLVIKNPLANLNLKIKVKCSVILQSLLHLAGDF